MPSSALLRLALKKTGYSQKKLAAHLSVSAAQVSKWKAGEHMSLDMEERLRCLAEIGERDPDVVYLAGGVEQADKWVKLVKHLANIAIENCECSYEPYPLYDEIGTLVSHVFGALTNAGAVFPTQFPVALDFDYESGYEENEALFEALYYEHSYSSLIYSALASLAQHYDFYAAYIQDLVFDDTLDLFSTDACNIEPCLFDLALAKVGEKSELLTNFPEFKYEILRNYKGWLEIVKNVAFKHHIPLKAEVMHLVSKDPEYLVHEAEAELFGFNSRRLHPDIYTDEILKSLRLIHQILPTICKKLGITQEELNIDESESEFRI